MLRAGAIAFLSVLCLSAVQGAEPQQSMPPALLEAIAGNEPYTSLVEYGLPLLNTPEEVEALPPALREAHAVAIKKVLLQQMVRAREERHRVTTENLEFCAGLARELEAPEVFALYLQLEAAGQLSPRAGYVVREALNLLYESYRVDALALRYFVEGSHLSAEELLEAAEWLPLAGLFNLTKKSELTAEKQEADFADYVTLSTEISAVLASVQSGEQADAAVEKLLPLLVRYAATAGTRHFSEPEQQRLLLQHFGEQLNRVYPVFVSQRKRLREANFYDSVRLRIVDYLLD